MEQVHPDIKSMIDPKRPYYCPVCCKDHPVDSMVVWCLTKLLKEQR